MASRARFVDARVSATRNANHQRVIPPDWNAVRAGIKRFSHRAIQPFNHQAIIKEANFLVS